MGKIFNKKQVITLIILSTLLLLFMITGSIISTSNIIRENLSIRSNTPKAWEKIFDSPSRINVEPLVTGYALISKSDALNMDHPNAKGLKDEVIIVPVISYLIHHKAYGYYLINTGLDISYQKDQYGRSKGIFVKNFKYKAFQMRGKSVSEILNKRHIKIEGIFLSSMNFDNISGLIDLPKYIKVYSGKKEVYKNYRFIFQTDELSGIKKIIEIDFNNSNIKETSILGRCYNFFGDGSLWLINTKGFSNGHMSFLINSINNPVLITADACFIKTGFDKIIGPGKISSDINEAQKSLNKLVEFKKKYPKVRVLFSHDLVSK